MRDVENSLGWHALNYRTAHTLHAEAAWQELDGFVKEQVRAAVDAALEAAAVACENERVDAEESGAAEDRCYNYATKHCAAAIRAMRSGVENI